MRCRLAVILALLAAHSAALGCRRSEAGASDDTSASGAASAAVGERATPGAQSRDRVEDFVAASVAAVNARDSAARVRLIHPQCVACMSADNRDFYDAVLWARQDSLPQACTLVSVQQLAPGRAADITRADGRACIVSVTAIPPGERPFGEGALSYPVRPTHQLQIQTGRMANDTLGMLVRQIQLVHDHDSWHEVVPCPTPEALRRFREQRRTQ